MYIGGGAWGTTLSALASAAGPTTLSAREPAVVESVRDRHENHQFMSNVILPDALGVTNELRQAVTDADGVVVVVVVVVVAVPAQHVRSVMAEAGPWIKPGALVVSVTKGLEVGSGLRMSEVLADVLGSAHAPFIGVLAGPNLAREVIAGTDVIGCEIGGAVKNAIVIARSTTRRRDADRGDGQCPPRWPDCRPGRDHVAHESPTSLELHDLHKIPNLAGLGRARSSSSSSWSDGCHR